MSMTGSPSSSRQGHAAAVASGGHQESNVKYRQKMQGGIEMLRQRLGKRAFKVKENGDRTKLSEHEILYEAVAMIE